MTSTAGEPGPGPRSTAGHELQFPFALELREQHDAVRSTAKWLEVELERSSAAGESLDAVVETLRVFRTQLVEHFHFEERGGFEGSFGSADPVVRRRAGDLVRQHRALTARLDAALARDDRPRAPADLVGELRLFFRALRQHDELEDALLQDVQLHEPPGPLRDESAPE